MTIPGNLLTLVTESVDPNTSGWTPFLNCTISLGIGGRNGGPGCLSVKSIAAGEMRARTVSSYPVVAGTLYQAFSDAAGAEVERIGIRWLNAAGTELSISWSMLTAAASASWHRVSLAAVAPPGTVRAQVVVSSSPTGAAVPHYWENVYLGLPIVHPGNLLPFPVGSIEVDTTDWAVEANGALSRQVPLAGWAVDFYTAGGHVLVLTAAAAGNTAARTVAKQPVTPGVDYMLSAFVAPPTAAASTWLELRFYDAAGTQLTANRATLAAPGTGFYLQKASGVAPPAAASCGVAFGLTSATTGQTVRVEDVVVQEAPAAMTGTVVPYSDASFEQGLGTWTKVSGVGTIARSTPWGAQSLEGSYAMTLTSTTATATTLRSGKWALPAGTGGQSFRLRIGQQVTAGGWTVTLGIRWYDAANTDLGLTTWLPTAAPTPGWWNFSFDEDAAPATATQAAAEIVFLATATNSVMQIDRVSLWQTLPLTTALVVPESASVTLTLRELPVGELLRVSRVTGDGMRTLVRGPAGLFDGTVPITSDVVVIEDYEAPLGIEVYYFVEVIDPDSDATDTRSSEPVTIPHADINLCWLKDVGNPQRNRMFMVEQAPEWARPIDQASYVVKNRRNKVTCSGIRNGREGSLVLWTVSDDDRDGLDWLLDSGNTLLWQTGPGVGEGNVYVSIGQSGASRGNQTADDPFRTWTLPLVESDMPVAVGVNGTAGRTWQDILSEFATWQEVLDTYATWEDVLLNKRKAA